MTPTSPQHPFMATILLAEQAEITNAMLKSALAEIWPQAGSALVTGGDDSKPASTCGIPGRMATFIQRDTPVPAGVFARALAMAESRWPEAKSAIESHKGHVVVSIMNPGEKPLDAVSEALFTTALSAAVAKALPALAVHWPASETLVSGKDFVAHSNGMKSNDLPLQLWFQLIPLQIDDVAGVPCRLMVSEGLRAFAGHELEFAASTTVAHEEMAPRMISLADTLITKGPIAKDGGTFGLTDADRCRLKFKPQGVRPNVPVLEMTAEALVPPPDSVTQRKAFGKRAQGGGL